ncbi:hypothetical protein fHeYen901_79 [Yersinia phage fHe-Yen9-01]|uniref:Uncharacterized protein n=1 Tax=Yersinia phage fHe-Yen9-01 TaxID=1965363 RepID=A0A1V0DXH6_9CAUD|nr:hypothetical protein KNT60_gp078 [Yersinia phage fHe-Yen9-01]ARB05852.1 hypothetical protein fHeYen901_79 [Yersinia phage fHe-Yen9-01]
MKYKFKSFYSYKQFSACHGVNGQIASFITSGLDQVTDAVFEVIYGIVDAKKCIGTGNVHAIKNHTGALLTDADLPTSCVLSSEELEEYFELYEYIKPIEPDLSNLDVGALLRISEMALNLVKLKLGH